MTTVKEKKTKKKWIKFRHRIVRNILYCILKPYSRIKYGIKIEKFKEHNGRQYLILLNHQTPFDQFFTGMAFKGAVYYLATEDIFSMGWVSSVIKYLVAPIPIKKQTTDVHAVINCIRVVKEGGTIAIAPEGNRTYSGRTEYMNPSIAFLAKKLGLPIAIFRIEGGYGVEPRWSDKTRRGKMRGYVSRVIEPEEYMLMDNDALHKLIAEELYVDEARADACFYSKRSAEYLERLIYICPKCGLSTFKSYGDTVECTKCHLKAKYLPTKEFESEDGLPFRFVADWYDYQKDFMNSLDVTEYKATPLFKDSASFSEVIVYKNKQMLRKEADITLYGDRVVVDEGGADEITFRFDDVTAASVLGRNKLNIYHDKRVYQLKGDKSFNAIKYVHTYYRYKNIIKGDENGQFLGL